MAPRGVPLLSPPHRCSATARALSPHVSLLSLSHTLRCAPDSRRWDSRRRGHAPHRQQETALYSGERSQTDSDDSASAGAQAEQRPDFVSALEAGTESPYPPSPRPSPVPLLRPRAGSPAGVRLILLHRHPAPTGLWGGPSQTNTPSSSRESTDSSFPRHRKRQL